MASARVPPVPPTSSRVDISPTSVTTPEEFQQIVQGESYWPKRSTHISLHTHRAVLFALEAIRSGRGVHAKPLSSDLLEEGARMSDLYASNPAGPRQQDAAGRSLQAESTSQTRIQTPREIMAARNAREARRAQQSGLQDSGRIPEEVVVAGATRQSAQNPPPPQTFVPRNPTTQSITISGRPNLLPVTDGMAQRAGDVTAPQARTNLPASYLATTTSANDPTLAPRVQRDRTETYEKLNMPAVAGTKAPQPQMASYPQAAPPSQPAGRSTFPHAFERWEQLSSHWEGLTSYWIRRLQENTNELDSKPIDKQMARQITDLSAAGANLFHAVVELQRLRASSERKFQRWFFETRSEREQAQERIAELERSLDIEKRNPRQAAGNAEGAQAEMAKAEALVGEMRRELQISKEEARRAWEELGRREQEERERTIALRSGEPTLIGGVQVLPMQGLSSRQNTVASNRPVTRDGPYPGGPTQTMMGGQQPRPRSQTSLDSPMRGQASNPYYRGATSPTDTDPFTEQPRQVQPEPPTSLRREPDTRFYSPTSPRDLPSTTRAAVTSPIQPSQASQQARQELASSGPSYVPSSSSPEDEEYHMDSKGNYILDDRGRRIPYREALLARGYEDVATDDEDHTADIARERQLQSQYAQRQAGSTGRTQGQSLTGTAPSLTINPDAARSPVPPPTTVGAYHDQVTSPVTMSYPTESLPAASSQQYAQITPEQQQRPFSGVSPPSTTSSLTPQTMPGQIPSSGRVESYPTDYSGDSYGPAMQYSAMPSVPSGNDSAGMSPQVLNPSSQPAREEPLGTTTTWEDPAYRYPTRLSDIQEERTSPSRASYADNGIGNNNGRTRR